MRSINYLDLCGYLRQFKSTFIGFVSETVPEFKKGGRGGTPLFTVATGRDPSKYRKITEGVVLVGTSPDYSKLVGNRLAKMGLDPMPKGDRKWGTKIDNVEVQHTKKGETELRYYVTFHFVANNQPKVRYTYEGRTIELTDTEKEYLKKSSGSKKQEEAGLPLDLQVIHRDYECKHIKSITVNGETIPVI